jgi:hypothetical protein
MGKSTTAQARLPRFLALRLIKAARGRAKNAPEPAPPEPAAPPRAPDLLDEIDEIFGEIKAKRRQKTPAAAAAAAAPPKRRFTEDGLPIFTEEELQMNNPRAGTTPLCPFDCDCCH